MKELIVGKNDAGQRLDKFLGKAFPDLAKSMMYKGLRNKKIKVNRKRASYNQILEEGDVILLFLPDDALMQKSRTIGSNADIDVIYEDDNLLIVNKPAGLLSQKDSAQDQDTLNDRILAYLVLTKAWNPETETSFTPAICHRLDRNTSGLVAAAKSAAAAREMSRAIREHDLGKEYLAVVEGTPENEQLHLYLKKEGLQAKIFDQPADGAAEAITDVQVLESKNNRSLVHLDLHTGRFHQIRASLAHQGHPLIGDVKYGGIKTGKPYQLQAYALSLENVDLPNLPKRVELPKDKQLKLS